MALFLCSRVQGPCVMLSVLPAQVKQEAAKKHRRGEVMGVGWGGHPFLQDHAHPCAHRLAPAKMRPYLPLYSFATPYTLLLPLVGETHTASLGFVPCKAKTSKRLQRSKSEVPK